MGPSFKKNSEEKEASPAFDASTVILTRDKGENSKEQYEIYLQRRSQKQKFMGGAFVFPGGRVSEDDNDPELNPYTGGFSASNAKNRLKEPDISEEKAIGLFFAGMRETYEEAGILLAYTHTGELLSFMKGDEEAKHRFANYRTELYNKRITLKRIAEMENIQFALDLLLPYSHWITPRMAEKRFDTRFFIARAPMGQSPMHDDLEMIESLWISPSGALERHKKGEILLMPPTLKTIEELNEFQFTHQLFNAAYSSEINTILPQPFETEDGYGIKLPHDPEYSIADYKQNKRIEGSSRIVMQDGRWVTKRMSR